MTRAFGSPKTPRTACRGRTPGNAYASHSRRCRFRELAIGTSSQLEQPWTRFSPLGASSFYPLNLPTRLPEEPIFFWIRLFGDSEISVRMPSLISGILSIFLVYTLSSTLAGKRTALIATFLLCLSPVHIWYSQEARSYSLTLCLLLVSILSYYKLKEHGTKSIWYVIYCVSLCVAVLSHYFVIVYLMSISMMCLIKINKVKRNVLILNVLIVASLIVFLALKYMFANISTGQEYLRSFTLFGVKPIPS